MKNLNHRDDDESRLWNNWQKRNKPLHLAENIHIIANLQHNATRN